MERVAEGDLLLSVDGIPVNHMAIQQIKRIIFGPFGSVVELM